MLSSFAGAQTGKTDNQFAMTRETLSSEMKMKLYLKLLENFAGWIESSDTFKDDETIEKGGGAFLAKGAGVTWPRGNSNLCIIYATLLTALPDQSHFSRYRIPRAQMEDHLRRTLRALCLTNKNCARCINPARWGGPSWQAALEFKGAAWAAHLMEKQLDAETVALVKEITCKEADNLDKPIATAAPGNTGSEDCSWNTPLLALAANKYPDHPHAARWQELARRWAVNAVSIASDKSNTQTLDGKPVKEWMASENLFADLTLENHGFWSTPYQSAFSLLLDGALAYRIFDRPVPETLSYRAREMWRTVTGPISVWDGDMLFPHGQDWAWKSYAHLEYFCWLNTLLKIPEAGAFESRAIQMTLRRQQAIGTGDLKLLDLGHQTAAAGRWAFCLLAHKYFGAAPAMPYTQADESLRGVHIYPYVKTAIHRTDKKLVSVSWHKHSQAVFVFPEGDSTFTDPPFFLPYDRYMGVTKVSALLTTGGAGQLSASSSSDEKYSPAMAGDGDPDTWWVTGSQKPGDGPTAEKPQWIQLSYPTPQTFGRLLLCPRVGYGPRDCELLCSSDGRNFKSLKKFTAAQEPRQIIDFPQVIAQYFRLSITSAFDPRSPENPRTVQVAEMRLFAPNAEQPQLQRQNGSERMTLMEAGKTSDDLGMRVILRKDFGFGVQQFIATISLPDEATLYATAFQATDDITAIIGPVFPVSTGAPPGFEKPIKQYRGRRWLNMSDHLGFISADDLPTSIPANRFVLCDEKKYRAQAGQWFAPQVLAIYARQPHDQTEKLAEDIKLVEFRNGEMRIAFASSTGKHEVRLNFTEPDSAPQSTKGAAAMPATAKATSSVQECFLNPLARFRILKIIHNMPVIPGKQDDLLASLSAQGFGGMVTNVPFQGYLENEANWQAFLRMVPQAKKAGMALWLYDERGYPSGAAGGLTLRDHPEWEARGLLIADAATTGGAVSLDVPPGSLLRAAAFPAKGGVIDLEKAVDLSKNVRDGKVAWDAPAGDWRVMAITEDRLYDGTHASVSLGDKLPYVNLLSPEPTARFLELTHGAYARRLGDDLGKFFIGTFTDEPSLMSMFFQQRPWRPLPWSPAFAREFQARRGYAVEPVLPALAADAGSRGQRARYDFWLTVGELVSENYFRQIRDWCRRHDVPSGGHLLLEEPLLTHVALYGDLFRCERFLDAPSLDCLTSLPPDVHWFSARLISSAAELEGRPDTMCETSDHAQRYRPKGDARPVRIVTEEEIRGTCNRLILNGMTCITSYYSFAGLSDDQLRRINTWVGRCCAMLYGGHQVADVAVLYPIESVWPHFEPSHLWTKDAPPSAQQIERIYRQSTEHLFLNRRDFTFIDSRTLAEAEVAGGSANMAGGELRYHDLRWRVAILPGVDTLPLKAWENLARFWRNGGAIIAIGALPLNSESDFPSPAVQSLAKEIFGEVTIQAPAKTSSAGREFHWNINAKGGAALFLLAGAEAQIPAALNAVLDPDVRIAEGDINAQKGKGNPAAKIEQGKSPIRVTHRRINGDEIFFLINDSPNPFEGEASLSAEGAGEQYDPATGAIMPISSSSGIRIHLDPYAGVLFRFSKSHPSARRTPVAGK